MSSRRQKLTPGARGPKSAEGSLGITKRQQRRKYCFEATAPVSSGGGRQRKDQRGSAGKAIPTTMAKGETNLPQEAVATAAAESEVQRAAQPVVAEPDRREGDNRGVMSLIQKEAGARVRLALELEAQLLIPISREPTCNELLIHYLAIAEWRKGTAAILCAHRSAAESLFRAAREVEELFAEGLRARAAIVAEAEAGWSAITSQAEVPFWVWDTVAAHLPPGVDAKRQADEVRLCVGVDAVPWCRGSLYVPVKEAVVRKYDCSLVVDRLPGWATRWNARSLGSIAWQSRFTSKVIRNVRAGDLLYSWVGTAAADGYWHTGDLNLARVCGLNHGDVGITFSMVGCVRVGTAILQVAIVHKVSQPSALTRIILRQTGLLACCRPGDFLVFYEPGAASLGKFALPSVADREVQARASWALAERNLPAEIHAAFAVVKTRALGSSNWDLDPFMVRRELTQAAAACLPAGGPAQA